MPKIVALAFLTFTAAAGAAPVTYEIDPNHTFPAFEVDHMGGLSIIRGKFDTTSGKVTLDRAAGTGSIEVTIDASSIDLGHERLEKHVRSADMLDVAKYPTAAYRGTLAAFKNGAPTEVHGELTLHGVTRPVNLRIDRFLCKPHPMTHREVCGADAEGRFDRADFGIDYGKANGFKMEVTLRISIEAQQLS